MHTEKRTRDAGSPQEPDEAGRTLPGAAEGDAPASSLQAKGEHVLLL